MPVLAINQPIERREPTLVVGNRLAPGGHRFSLVVVNDRGVASAPDLLTVTVRRTIVLEPVRPPLIGTIADPVVDPVLRPRGSASRKGTKHGPE